MDQRINIGQLDKIADSRLLLDHHFAEVQLLEWTQHSGNVSIPQNISRSDLKYFYPMKNLIVNQIKLLCDSKNELKYC